MNNKETIIIAEDDVSLSKLIKLTLENESIEAVCLRLGANIIDEIDSIKPGLILMDYRLPDMSADTIINKLSERNQKVPFIIMTGYTDVEIAIKMMKLGAKDYLIKDTNFLDLLPAIVNRIIEELKTSRKLAAAEIALKESEDRYRTIVENSAILICHLIKSSWKISFVNNAFRKYFNMKYNELIGEDISILFPGKDVSSTKKEIDSLNENDQIRIYESSINDGEDIKWQRWTIQALFDDKKNIKGLQCIGEDITDWKKAIDEKEKILAQLMQSQKMDAIGILAGGVAHDFNNLLTTIIGSTNLIMLETKESDPIYINLKQIHYASTRAADLTRQLLLFSRNQKIKLESINLNNTVNNLLKMICRLIGEDIKIDTDLEDDLWITKADESNIEQVLMNLVINSRDAMPEGGKLKIKTKNVLIDEEKCGQYPEARKGSFISLSVIDTGSGIDKKIKQRIFEPFFSTKNSPNSTGLGLAVVFGIVKQHKGWIHVKSESGKGAMFEIFLPAVSMRQDIAVEEPIELDSLHGNGERILIVEDEDEVRKFVLNALSSNGYVVFGGANAEESEKMFDIEKGNFDLVFCDVVLPDKNGLQLIETLIGKNPKISVLFCSGYTDHKSQWPVISEKGFRFLEKPYSLFDLLQAVKSSLAPQS